MGHCIGHALYSYRRVAAHENITDPNFAGLTALYGSPRPDMIVRFHCLDLPHKNVRLKTLVCLIPAAARFPSQFQPVRVGVGDSQSQEV